MAEAASPPPLSRRKEGPDRSPPTTTGPITHEQATFVTLKSKIQTRLSTVNSCLIKKVIDVNIGTVANVKILASGDLLVETLNAKQVTSLISYDAYMILRLKLRSQYP